MSRRHAVLGARLDRSRKIAFTWDGRRYEGFAGDTLASALLANDVVLMGRSFKYHRPRGVLASGAEEPNALVGLGRDGRFEPNARATVVELADGLEARPQNAWPSLSRDFGAVAARFASLLPAGFYYKTFMAPRGAWKSLFEPLIRRSAGLGAAPSQPDADAYEHRYDFVDVLVVGGGVAGLAAARAAAAAGARVMVVEQSAGWGGRAVVDGGQIAGAEPAAWVAATVDALGRNPKVRLCLRATATSVEDHSYVLVAERLAGPGPRERLWRIRARRVVVAAGAIERPLAFAGNDRPGVMLASAVRDYLALWGVAAGARVVVATASDDAYRTALALHAAGVEVPAIVDARNDVDGALPAAARAAGLRVLNGAAVAETGGVGRLAAIGICDQAGSGGAVRERIACDALAMSGGWSPAVHLWSQPGGKVAWDAERACFLPDPARPPRDADGAVFVLPAGSAAGAWRLADVLASGHGAGRRAAEEVGLVLQDDGGDEGAPPATDEPEAAPLAVWRTPAQAGRHLRKQTFIDFQNDVKATDVELAAREGYASVEHAKRYTTLGMATDQGKTSNVPGLATLAAALGSDIPSVGVTTFRPPYTPVTFGALAGEARGPLFKPTRRTPMDAWHSANGAEWEPVADWRRPYCYRRPGETTADAVAREVRAVRERVGLLDASTLGKILVAGPDAGRFLDLVYTGVMSSLPVGRCRYGLMCNENGFLFDDGVVARLGPERFLCHTTTGGADRVHGWLEEWLQTEWWDLDVWVANLTEQFAQVAVAGPRARDVVAALVAPGSAGPDIGPDLGPDALPHMAFVEAQVAGLPARIHRISFTGELSYEIAVPASGGPALWDALLAAGAAFGVEPYGTEAMHVLRAEKGYIIVGDESDGTVTPQDLGLGWAVSKKKPDFIGKRAQERADLTRSGRKQLVGLMTEDPQERLPDGALAVDAHGHALGHVTSSYMSPTLGRAIALGLVEGGAGRMGEVIDFPLPGGGSIRAAIVAPAFYDPEGERLHG